MFDWEDLELEGNFEINSAKSKLIENNAKKSMFFTISS